MSWLKIDTDCAIDDSPASAFVAVALRRNANAYPAQLARSCAHAYERFDNGSITDGPQHIATHPDIYAGNWYYVDVGTNATLLVVRLRYRTATATETLRVTIRHRASGAVATGTLVASTGITTQDFTMTLREPLSGVQTLWVGFQSVAAEEPDTYPPSVFAAAGSQVYGFQPASPGAPWSGRTTKLLVLPAFGDTSTDSDTAPKRLFVGYSAPATEYDAGSDVGLRMDVWPDVETQPAMLPYQADVTKAAFAATYDLGVCFLFGVSFAVIDTAPVAFTPDYAHDGMAASAMPGYQTPQRVAAETYGHTLAIAPSPNADWHGRVLSRFDTESRVFVARDKAVKVRANVSCIATRVGDTQPKLRLEIFDNVGLMIDSIDEAVAETDNYIYPRRTLTATAGDVTSLALANMRHAPELWGMGSTSSNEDTIWPVAFTLSVATEAGAAYTAVLTYDPDSVAGPGLLVAFGLNVYDLVQEV